METLSIFKVASLPSNHVFRMNISLRGDVKPLGGVEFLFLDILTQCMKVKFSIVVPSDGEFGRKRDDGKWTGIIGMVINGEADIGLNMIALTSARNEAVNFSYPYMVDGTTFVTQIPGFLPKTLAYFYPFEKIVWLCLILILIFIPFIFKYVFFKRYFLVKLYFGIFASFFQQPFNIHLTKLSQEILSAAWFFYARLLTLFYSAVLLSFVTIPLMAQGLYSINQVAQAVVQKTHKCYIFSGTADQDAFYNAKDGPLKIIGDSIKKNDYLVKHGSHIEFYIPNSESVLIGSRSLILFNYMEKEYEKYYVSKEFFYITLLAMPIKKNFCCLNKMNKCIFRIVAAGLYQKCVEDEVFKIKLKSVAEQDDGGTNALKISDIYGAFIFLVGGYTAAGISLCVEILCYRKSISLTLLYLRNIK